MRGSLSGVRSRVDRLALKLVPLQAAGCASCRGQEDAPRVIVFYGHDAPQTPGKAQCRDCGRVIPYRYMFIGYDANMRPDDVD